LDSVIFYPFFLQVDPAAVATVAQLVPINSAITGFKELAGYNQLINGGMEIWHRGIPITINPNTALQYTADRWACRLPPLYGNSITFDRSTDIPPGIPVRNSLKITIPVDFKTIFTSSGDFVVAQRIESGQNFINKPMTVSFWIKGVAGATILVNLSNTPGAWYTLTGDWQYIVYSVPSVGSTFNGEVDIFRHQWSYEASDIKAGDYYITAVKCEVGLTPTPYVPRAYGEEIRLCQRFLYRFNAQLLYRAIMSSGSANTQFNIIITPAVFPMRVKPTLIYDNTLDVRMRIQGSDVSIPWSKFLEINDRSDGYNINFNSIEGVTFPARTVIGYVENMNQILYFDSEIY
jgi:hypothetical protein